VTSSRLLKQQLTVNVLKVSGLFEATKDKLRQLVQNENSFLQQILDCERRIRDKRDELKCVIDAQYEQLVDEVKSIGETRQKEIATKRDETERQLLILDSFMKYSDELIEKGSACDISRQAPTMIDRVAEIETMNVKVCGERLCTVELRFTSSTNILDVTDGLNNWIGTVARQTAQG